LKRLFWVAGLVVAVFVGVSGFAAEKPAALSLKDTNGAKVKLSDLRGKIVVLNFWATWCGPCNAEMPMLVKASSIYAGKNVTFVGASVDAPETQGKVAGYMQKLQIDYQIWMGATDVDMKRLQMGEAVPGTAFIDTDGVIRLRVLGQMRPGEIEERIDWLLSDRHGTAPAARVKHLDEKQ
jgi:thiol-disulfide isomerase/thioredoxin